MWLVIQALSEQALVSTFDLSLLALLGWDLGTRESINSLQLDEAYLAAPFSMVPSCAALTPLLTQLRAEIGGGPVGSLLRACASTTVRKLPSVCCLHTLVMC